MIINAKEAKEMTYNCLMRDIDIAIKNAVNMGYWSTKIYTPETMRTRIKNDLNSLGYSVTIGKNELIISW